MFLIKGVNVMDEILNLSINEMPQTEFDCSCGKHHNFSVHDMSIRKGAIEDLPKMAEPFKDGKILVVFDNHTYEVAGKRAVELLKENGFNVKELLFDTGDDILIPDEKTLGRIVQEQDLDTSLMVAVGSGVINDSVKFVTSRSGLPYIIVATAPSMDGYVADGAPIFSQGYKYSPVAHLTYGLVGDTDILKTAPQDLIQAGYGDVVGKITAIADWDLAVKANNDYRCDTCVTLVNRALDKCFAKAEGLKDRDPESLGALLEALTLTGVAMALVNISRPASGAEHMLSHFWEMDYIARGLNPNHHGIQVGVATPIIARFFEELADILPEGTGALCPPHEEIEALLAKGGAPTSPKDIGISKELFHDSLLKGYTVRPRYSIMQFAKDNGRLEEIADKITEEIYG
jgi:glycerol-1-phosphate dehydrogenase [NAD(P)+]